jgi:hypothetical protein
MASAEKDRYANRSGRNRDNALRRLRTVTKGIAVATAAAVGVLGLYVSKALPGHAATHTSQSTATTLPPTTAPAPVPSSGSSPTQTVPAPPPSPPVTTPRPSHVTTGAS